MADTSVKLSGTYDSIEAYNIMLEMQNMSADYETIRTEAAAAASAATAASTAATNAINVANTAVSNAQTYAGNANDSADNAAGYASNASTSATNAASSATDASNSAAAAATSETNAAASASSAAASEAVVNGALPLSGGTMTGTLTLGGFPAIKNNNNTSNITITGSSSTGAGDGAKLILTGADNTDAGAWTVQAGNSGGYKQLVGKATGEFTWGGSNVAVMGTLQNGHGILTGRVSSITVNANSYKQDTVSFGQTFASAPHVIVCCAYGHAFVEAGVRAITTTGFGYTVSNQNNSTYSNEAIEWIAIG